MDTQEQRGQHGRFEISRGVVSRLRHLIFELRNGELYLGSSWTSQSIPDAFVDKVRKTRPVNKCFKFQVTFGSSSMSSMSEWCPRQKRVKRGIGDDKRGGVARKSQNRLLFYGMTISINMGQDKRPWWANVLGLFLQKLLSLYAGQ